LVTDSLGKINVTNYNVSYDGFSTPCFSRLPDGTTILVIGSEEGRIHLFGSIDHNLNGKFSESDTLFHWLSATPGDTAMGWQTSPAIAHLTDPLAFDMVTGNFSGGLNYITKRTPAEIIPGTGEKNEYQPVSLKLYPNPADQTVTIQMTENSRPAIGRIDNLFGQNVLSFPSGRSTVVNVSALPDGVYVIRIGEVTAKLMIAHP
jgi:hypothetical protein